MHIEKLLCTAMFLISFFVTRAQMSDTALIIGRIDHDQLEEYSWYGKNFDAYQPDNTIVKQLEMYAPKLRFTIVMGTWCDDSHEYVPAFFKTASKCGIDMSKVEMIGVNRKKHCPYPDISALNIEYVPTFFVFYDNVLVGKIVENPKKNIEGDLLELLINTKQ